MTDQFEKNLDEAPKKNNTSSNNKAVVVPAVSVAPNSLSLYEQHKALLRNRYNNSNTVSTKSSDSSSSSSWMMKDNNNPSVVTVNREETDVFTTKLQNALRTSPSFVHLQQQPLQQPGREQKNVQGAYAA